MRSARCPAPLCSRGGRQGAARGARGGGARAGARGGGPGKLRALGRRRHRRGGSGSGRGTGTGHGGTMDDLGEFRAARAPPRRGPPPHRAPASGGRGPPGHTAPLGPRLPASGDVSFPAHRAGPPGSPRRRPCPGPLSWAVPGPPPPARSRGRRSLSRPGRAPCAPVPGAAWSVLGFQQTPPPLPRRSLSRLLLDEI